MNDVSKNWKFGQKTQFVAPKKSNFGQSKPKKACRGARHYHARNPKLPRDSLGYGDDILILEKSVGVQKMEVYGFCVKKIGLFGQRMGLKPAQ